jgi:gluconate 2-dehydrogenase gamma chain
MESNLSRRWFLSQSLTGISAAWMSAHWPAMLSAATYARHAAQSAAPAKFEFFSADHAAEVDAISARIIPTTDTPGAHEAGVVFFIDRALATFAKDDQKAYTEGLPELHAKTHEMFPSTQKFSAATLEQQDQILQSLDEQSSAAAGSRRSRRGAAAQSFFETVRVHTIMGFLIDPDSDKRGNRDAVGWKVIGRDNEHMFQPPFGYYDKDYPGWQTNPPDTEKSKS